VEVTVIEDIAAKEVWAFMWADAGGLVFWWAVVLA
jgi:hypothetical protein